MSPRALQARAVKTLPLFPKPQSEEHLKLCLRSALLTREGERPLNPKLGSRLMDFLFQPLTPELLRRVETHVREVIEFQEPRVECVAVAAQADKQDPNRLTLLISYRNRDNQSVRSFQLSLVSDESGARI